jgi:hypothetical protein
MKDNTDRNANIAKENAVSVLVLAGFAKREAYALIFPDKLNNSAVTKDSHVARILNDIRAQEFTSSFIQDVIKQNKDTSKRKYKKERTKGDLIESLNEDLDNTTDVLTRLKINQQLIDLGAMKEQAKDITLVPVIYLPYRKE